MYKKRISHLKQQRIPELDGLRGIAIMLVIFFHYLNNQLLTAGNFIGKALCKATSFGWIGVDLFFLLSGFLIGTILIQNKNSKNYFSTFYLRRLVRIIPNYFLLIIVFMIILVVPYFAGDYFLTGNNVLPIWSYFTMVHNFFMARLNNLGNGAMSVTWSIGIEEQFYIVFPFIVYYLKDKWLPYLLIVAIVLAVIFRMQYNNWIPAYVLLPCRMDAIAFGALIAWFNYHYDLKEWVNRKYNWLLLVMTIDIFVCGLLYYKYADLGSLRNTYFGIFFSLCLVFALTKKNTFYAALLRNKIFVWIGTISYSLYLFHYMILGICRNLTSSEMEIKSGRDILISIFAFLLSLLFSWILYKKLETPMVNIGKRFKY
jgi:peptidoglycan/LPS O-acetylase OafA/YrhL